ncbi:AEC family transporter [Xylocopilactobacillus apicola]|uniref:Malate transporter n=1 Tax=Xylocopilactobacillus apicola TaxID=2932184 RepID=A0AAU9CXU9_9LACO|nr:AEC family transporter [Xylocopilactobacillus apicola]BDR58837.1 malate transporter [Xylocopilactobacillus apicola]
MLAVFFRAIQGILVVIVMIGVGYFFAKKGWFDRNFTKTISRIVTNIALPCYMIATITNQFTLDKLQRDLPMIVFPFISMIILFGFSLVIVRLLRIPKHHQGIFSSMFFNSNTVFIGLPVNIALFGDKSLPFVLVYYIANTTIFWTLGVWLIQKDGQICRKLTCKELIGRIFSPPLVGFMIAIILVILPFNIFNYVPFLYKDLVYLGGLTIPLSMIFIGISIAGIGFKQIKIERSSLGILAGRFFFAPLFMAIMLLFTNLPVLVKQIFIIQSAMPVMTNAPIVANIYGADADFASIMVAESTLLSLIVIPILMALVQLI